MSWTNISKPTDSTYTKLSKADDKFFDDSGVTFDDANTFFDGISVNIWTNISRPIQTEWIEGGMITGLLIPLTYSVDTRTKDPWTRVIKPN